MTGFSSFHCSCWPCSSFSALAPFLWTPRFSPFILFIHFILPFCSCSCLCFWLPVLPLWILLSVFCLRLSGVFFLNFWIHHLWLSCSLFFFFSLPSSSAHVPWLESFKCKRSNFPPSKLWFFFFLGFGHIPLTFFGRYFHWGVGWWTDAWKHTSRPSPTGGDSIATAAETSHPTISVGQSVRQCRYRETE